MKSSTPNLGRDQELVMTISWSLLLWNRKCSTLGRCREFSSRQELTKSSSIALRNHSTIQDLQLTSSRLQKPKACHSTTRKFSRLRSVSTESGSCAHQSLRSNLRNQSHLRNKARSSEQEALITSLLSVTINTHHGKSSRPRWHRKTTRLSFVGRSTRRELTSLMTSNGWWNQRWLKIRREQCHSQESWSTEEERSFHIS